MADFNGVERTYANKDEYDFEGGEVDEPTGLMEDLDDIVGLGEQVAKNKLTYSFRGIFGGQR